MLRAGRDNETLTSLYLSRRCQRQSGNVSYRLLRTKQETSDQLLAAILDLSAGDRSMGRGAVNGGVNFAEQTSQDILEVTSTK